MKLPLWVKILLILFPLMLIFSVLGAVSEFLIPPVFLLAFVLFPGPDRAYPRLVRLIPWLWGIEWVLALIIFIAGLAGKNLFGPEGRSPTQPELWSTLLFAPPMVWALGKRHKVFRPLLIFQAIAGVAITFWVYSTSANDLKAVFELCGDLLGELMLTIYLLAKVKIPSEP